METQTQAAESQSQAQGQLKYADLLARSKDQKDAAVRDLQVEEAKQDVDGAILKNKKAINLAKRTLEEEKGKFPLNIEKILEATTDLEDLNNGLKSLENLKAELF